MYTIYDCTVVSMILSLCDLNFIDLSLSLSLSLTAQYLAVQRLVDSTHRDKEVDVACSEQVTVTYDDVRHAFKAVRPSAMREVAIEVPKVR